MSSHDELVLVAKLGRTHALNGAMKLHNLSDFYEQFRPGAKFFLRERGGLKELEIEAFDAEKSLVKFKSISSITAAKALVNAYLYSTKARTAAEFALAKDEYFYFDVIGLDVIEDGVRLGKISDIFEQGANFLFEIITDPELAARYEKQFAAEAMAASEGAGAAAREGAGESAAAAAGESAGASVAASAEQKPASRRAAKRAALAAKKAAAKQKRLPQRFFIPYVDAYIAAVEPSAGRVLSRGALAILLNS